MKLRQNKIADRIRDVIAEALTGDRLRDPRVQGLVVTRVKITADLQLASIYFRSYHDSSSNDEHIKGLESCRGYFRRVLSDALIMRKTPQLRFFYDESLEKKAQIEKLLEQIKDEK